MVKKTAAVMVILLCVSSMDAQEKRTLAVLDFGGYGIEISDILTATNSLRNELRKLDSYNIIKRSDMLKVLMQNGLPLYKCISVECIVKSGTYLGADIVLTGSIIKFASAWKVEILAIEVATGEILKKESYDVEGLFRKAILKGMSPIASDFLDLQSGDLTEIPRFAQLPAKLIIVADPSDAVITVNWSRIGKDQVFPMPVKANMPLRIALAKNGYLPFDTTLTPTTGEIIALRFALEHKMGYVDFQGAYNARIYIDREQIGQVPFTAYLALGNYDYQIKKAAFYSVSSNFSVSKDMTTIYLPPLKPMPKSRALLLSTIFPGLGQIYFGELKGFVFAYASIPQVISGFKAYKKYRSQSQVYHQAMTAYNDEPNPGMATRLRSKAEQELNIMMQNYDEYRYSLWALGGIWTVNIIDIVF